MHRDWADLQLLVCDDDASVRLTVRTFVARELGCTVAECASALEALRLLADTPFDGLVLDLQMPELDGFEMLRRLQLHRMSLPVLVLTSDAREFTVRRAVALGAREFVSKPPKPTVLTDRIRRMMVRERYARRAGGQAGRPGTPRAAARRLD